jgi:hypothetical protein
VSRETGPNVPELPRPECISRHWPPGRVLDARDADPTCRGLALAPARSGGQLLPSRWRAGAALRADVRADHPGVDGLRPGTLVLVPNRPAVPSVGGRASDDVHVAVVHACATAEGLLVTGAPDRPTAGVARGDIEPWQGNLVLPAADPARALRSHRTRSALRAPRAGVALRAGGAGVALRAGGSLLASIALRPLWAGRAGLALERAQGGRAQLVRAERAVLDVAAGDGAVLDVLAGDGDRGIRRAAERGEQRQVRDGGAVAAEQPPGMSLDCAPWVGFGWGCSPSLAATVEGVGLRGPDARLTRRRGVKESP